MELRKVSKSFPIGQDISVALEGVSLKIKEGDMLSIMGNNGSGKTSLLRQLGLLDYPTSGQVFIDGQDVTHMPEQMRRLVRLNYMAFIFQEKTLISELTAFENVCLPALIRGRKNYRAEAREYLKQVKLDQEDWKLMPHELSPGQRQRVALARIMIEHPKILLADEPTASLDPTGRGLIMQLIQDLNRQLGVTVVIISNDTEHEKYVKSLLFLSNGQVVAAGPAGDGSGY